MSESLPPPDPGLSVPAQRPGSERIKAKHDRDLATAELAEVEATGRGPASAIAADYRPWVDKLNEELADPKAREEALLALHGLTDRLVLFQHTTERSVEVEVAERLAAMLTLAGFSGQPADGPTVATTGGACRFVMERVKGIEPSS